MMLLVLSVLSQLIRGFSDGGVSCVQWESSGDVPEGGATAAREEGIQEGHGASLAERVVAPPALG